MANDPDQSTYRSTLVPIGALAMCAFLWAALVTFDPGDWPSPNQYPHHSPAINACGAVGAWCAYQLRYFIGDGVYPLLLFATLAAFARLIRGQVDNLWQRAFGLTLVGACTSAASHLIFQTSNAALPVGDGGVIGYALGEVLRQNLDRFGTLIVLVCSLFVGLLFTTEGWVLKLPAMLRRVGRASGGDVTLARDTVAGDALPKAVLASGGVTADERRALLGVRRPDPKIRSGRSRSVADDNANTIPRLPFKREIDEGDDGVTKEGVVQEAAIVEVESGIEVDATDEHQWESLSKSKRTTGAKRPPGPIVNFPTPQQVNAAEPYPRRIENWTLPSLDLLHQPEYGFSTQQEAVVRKQARILEKTLEEFRLDAQVVEIDTGPVITMFELKLGTGIKVSQIATLSNDIARALKAHAIRVVAPISGKNTIGIEVPNVEKEKVRLHELMTLAGNKASKMALPLFLGKDAGGAPLVTDLTEMPHLLLAGTTGSGKSVSLSAIILSLLMTKRPDHVKMILIDPKMVEMSQFKDMPHLMCPIVTDLGRAEKILGWAVGKMDERYELLAEARVKNIAGYNSLGADRLYARLTPATEQERALIPVHLPNIVIIIDELADLMMTAAKEVEHHLSRLAQKSRAVGLHIVVATQRPEVKVVTGLIKSNLPSRICFRVASRMDSRIVLDQNGGEVLLGQGDMLFLPPGSHKLMRAQGTFLDEAEIRAVLNDLSSRARPEFHPELVRLRTTESGRPSLLRDPLFDEAVHIILQSKRGSVSLIQRRLTIGYSRASRLVDQMTEAGIVGEYKGSQAREVLMTLEQWEALQARIAADREAGYEADRDDVADSTSRDKAALEPADSHSPAG